MHVSALIARRYLFAKKSMGVINIISMISAAGIAVGCAALVIILSVYNGFDSVILQLNDSYTADIQITPSSGKVFDAREGSIDALRGDPSVRAFCEVLQENVFLQYGDSHQIASARGVDSLYGSTTLLGDYLVEGKFELTYGEIPQVVMGRTLARQLGVRSSFVSPLEVYFPSRSARVDVLDPMASLRKVHLHPAGVLSLDQAFDRKYIFAPIDKLRELLEYEGAEVSSVELFLTSDALNAKGFVKRDVQKRIADGLGDGFVVRNKQEQNEMLYRLLRCEKIAIYLILTFIMIIISFNIFSSLSMLIIEKQDDIKVLGAMGADEGFIKGIFVGEGWLISLTGIAAGVVLGLLVCFLQQAFGFVKMPGNFVVEAYPVVVEWTDVLLSAGIVAAIGYLASALSHKLL